MREGEIVSHYRAEEESATPTESQMDSRYGFSFSPLHNNIISNVQYQSNLS